MDKGSGYVIVIAVYLGFFYLGSDTFCGEPSISGEKNARLAATLNTFKVVLDPFADKQANGRKPYTDDHSHNATFACRQTDMPKAGTNTHYYIWEIYTAKNPSEKSIKRSHIFTLLSKVGNNYKAEKKPYAVGVDNSPELFRGANNDGRLLGEGYVWSRVDKATRGLVNLLDYVKLNLDTVTIDTIPYNFLRINYEDQIATASGEVFPAIGSCVYLDLGGPLSDGAIIDGDCIEAGKPISNCSSLKKGTGEPTEFLPQLKKEIVSRNTSIKKSNWDDVGVDKTAKVPKCGLDVTSSLTGGELPQSVGAPLYWILRNYKKPSELSRMYTTTSVGPIFNLWQSCKNILQPLFAKSGINFDEFNLSNTNAIYDLIIGNAEALACIEKYKTDLKKPDDTSVYRGAYIFKNTFKRPKNSDGALGYERPEKKKQPEWTDAQKEYFKKIQKVWVEVYAPTVNDGRTHAGMGARTTIGGKEKFIITLPSSKDTNPYLDEIKGYGKPCEDAVMAAHSETDIIVSEECLYLFPSIGVIVPEGTNGKKYTPPPYIGEPLKDKNGSCPSGYKLVDDHCVSETDCPAGYYYDNVEDICKSGG